MPTPCTICSHADRAQLDIELARNEVCWACLAREYDVSRPALKNHQKRHLDFLPAFQGSAAAPGFEAQHAELQRLYSKTLDTLAEAQAGVLHVLDSGTSVRIKASPTSIARLISEARKLVGQISALSAASPKDPTGDEAGKALDAAMSHALARFEERMASIGSSAGGTSSAEVEDAVIVDQVDGEDVDNVDHLDRLSGLGSHTPGPGAGSAPPASSPPSGDPFSAPLPENVHVSKNPSKDPEQTDHQRQAELYLAGLAPEVRAHIREVLDQHLSNDQLNPERIARPWPGNKAASADERRAAGWPDPPPLLPTPREIGPATPSTPSDEPASLPPHRG